MNSNKTNNKDIASNKSSAGFTLIELLITISIMTIITVVILTNYRDADRSRRVQLAADTVLSALTDARNASQSGKQAAGCVSPNPYIVRLDTASTSITVGCTTNTYQTYTLPAGTRFKGASMFVDNAATDKIYVDFYPPFANVKACSNPSGSFCSPDVTFTSASVIVESTTSSSVNRTITIDGVSGRIQ